MALSFLPGCAREADQDGSVVERSSGGKKMTTSNAMLQAYVAMRAGVHGVPAVATEPLLGRMYEQELVGELGAPQ